MSHVSDGPGLNELICNVDLPQLILRHYPDCGINPNVSQSLGRAVWRGDRNPSLSVYTDAAGKWRWRDHARDSSGGDALDFLVTVCGYSMSDGIRELKDEMGSDMYKDYERHNRPASAPMPKPQDRTSGAYSLPTSQSVAYNDFAAQAYGTLHDPGQAQHPTVRAASDYLRQRRLLDDELHAVIRLGVSLRKKDPSLDTDPLGRYFGRLIIPYWSIDGEQVVYIRGRALSETQTVRWLGPEGVSPPLPFNAPALHTAAERGWLLACEGESDALAALVSIGVDQPVIGLPGGNIPSETLAILAHLQVFILMDNDQAGTEHATRLIAQLSAIGATPHAIDLPDPFNDLGEMLTRIGQARTARWLTSQTVAHQGFGIYSIWQPDTTPPVLRYPTGWDQLDRATGGGLSTGVWLFHTPAISVSISMVVRITLASAIQGRPILLWIPEHTNAAILDALVAEGRRIQIGEKQAGLLGRYITLVPIGRETSPESLLERSHQAGEAYGLEPKILWLHDPDQGKELANALELTPGTPTAIVFTSAGGSVLPAEAELEPQYENTVTLITSSDATKQGTLLHIASTAPHVLPYFIQL